MESRKNRGMKKERWRGKSIGKREKKMEEEERSKLENLPGEKNRNGANLSEIEKRSKKK